MPGIKGQKWSDSKRRPFKKINLTLPVETAEQYEKKAKDRNISVSLLYKTVLIHFMDERGDEL